MRTLGEERATRWWQRRPPLRTLRRAATFIDDVHFALLFPKAGVELPTLFEAASDRRIEQLGQEWGPDTELVWGWKDELPRRGLAWYGRFVRGFPSFLSPALLQYLYPRTGVPGDFEETPLGSDARRIARTILLSGPTSTAALREALGADGRIGQARFSKAILELGRGLVVTHFGTEEQGAGWPSAVLELTARAFPVRPAAHPDEARRVAAGRFLDTMIRARPHELGNAFGFSAAAARVALEELVRRGEAVRDGPAYRQASAVGRSPCEKSATVEPESRVSFS